MAYSPPVLATYKIEAKLSGTWTDLAEHVDGPSGLHIKYGMDGNGPEDVVAGPGECTFALLNVPTVSGVEKPGYYSPRHANCRAGWGPYIPVRVRMTSGAIVDKVKFIGKIDAIDPAAGENGERLVRVVAYDGMHDLLQASVRELPIATDISESEAIDAVLDAVPTESQPLARSLDAGLESFPVAFYNLEGGAQAAGLIHDTALSAWARVYIAGDGTFVMKNRNTWLYGGSLAASIEGTFGPMMGLTAPTNADRCINLVRVTTHGLTVTPTPTDFLFILDPGTVVLGAGETREIWGDYSDPNDRQTKVGGADVITTLVPGVHYGGNSLQDGTGADLTGNLTVTLDEFGTTGKFTVTNTGAFGAWLGLGIQGRAIRDLGPAKSQSSVAKDYGERPADIDLPLQASPFYGQSFADIVKDVFSDMAESDDVTFLANESATVMGYALNVEPTALVQVSKYMHGLSDESAIVTFVEYTVNPNGTLICRWGLTQRTDLVPWSLGDTGFSELGVSTDLGF